MKHRQERVGEEIRETLSDILVNDISDPRLPVIFSVTRVTLTKDLRIARVHFTQIPEEEDAIEDTLEMLEGATGFLRTTLAQQVHLRYVPELEFYYDHGQRNRDRIEELLDEAKKDLPSDESPTNEN